MFYADRDYSPAAFRLYARLAPASGDLTVDIRDDGVTIFAGNYATLNKSVNLEEQAEDYADIHPVIEDGSVISFHIIDKAGAEGITGQLELESLDDEDDAGE